MTTFGMTNQGFKPKRIADVYDSLSTKIKTLTDPKTGEKPFVNESDDSLFMQFNFMVSEAIAECWEQAYQASTQRDPLTASGSLLKGLIQLNGLVAKFGSYTQINITLGGLANITIPQGSIISDETGDNTYTTDQAITLGSNGVGTGTATAQARGPQNPANNTIISIKSPVYGWNSVSNTSVVSVGAEPQTDTELHYEQQRATSATSYRQIDAIFAGLLNVSGVKFARAYQNIENTADSRGIPAKSLACVVVGGTNEDVAKVLSKKAANINSYYGNVTVPIINNQGETNNIKFSRPTNVDILVNVNITVTDSASFPASESDAIAQIKANILSYSEYTAQGVEGFAPGVDVVRTRLYTPINQVQGFKVNSLTIAKSGQTPAEQDVDIAWNEVANFTDANIIVTID